MLDRRRVRPPPSSTPFPSRTRAHRSRGLRRHLHASKARTTRSSRCCSRPSTPSACSSRPRSRSRSPRSPMTLAQTRVRPAARVAAAGSTSASARRSSRTSRSGSRCRGRSPAARMRELVLAIRAIWARWHEGTPLDFRGEFYTHTLMTPFFNPGPEPVRRAAHLPRRRRSAHDRGRGRGRRRLHGAPVLDREVHARDDAPRARARARARAAARSPTSRSRSR